MGNRDIPVALALAVAAAVFTAGFIVYYVEEWKKARECSKICR
jgi:hypothetical protein